MKNYRAFIFIELCLMLQVSAQLLNQGLLFAEKDFDGDGHYDWRADIVVLEFSRPGNLPVYEVRNQMRVSSQAFVLKATTTRIDFLESEELATNSLTYVHPQYGDTDFWLAAYQWEEPGFQEFIRQQFDEFPNKRVVILGTKYTDPDTGDVTLGWFQFSRPGVEPGTAFTLESWAYHPIPNEPIRAGEPPDLPEPAFTWGDEGVTVSWPEKAWMLRLEMATSLTPPVPWQPVDTGGLTSVTLPPPEGGTELYFRLVAPEL